ncbi:hypothetical protein [Paenibacillus polymyxa]|uniref:hypothetical protein n=1 Tax=Paenibacillus polymyxa TaxID=1406 RepID=UPI002ED54BDE
MESKKILLLGLLGFGVFTLLCGFATDFWTMFGFRFLVGISLLLPRLKSGLPSRS